MTYSVFRTSFGLVKKTGLCLLLAFFSLIPLSAKTVEAAGNTVSTSPKAMIHSQTIKSEGFYKVTQFKGKGRKIGRGRPKFGRKQKGSRFQNSGRGTVTIKRSRPRQQANRRPRSRPNQQTRPYSVPRQQARRGTKRSRPRQQANKRPRSRPRQQARRRVSQRRVSTYKRKSKRRSSRSARRTVIKVQRRLKRVRLYRGRIDGIMGRLTRRGIRLYKKRYGSTRKLYR